MKRNLVLSIVILLVLSACSSPSIEYEVYSSEFHYEMNQTFQVGLSPDGKDKYIISNNIPNQISENIFAVKDEFVGHFDRYTRITDSHISGILKIDYYETIKYELYDISTDTRFLLNFNDILKNEGYLSNDEYIIDSYFANDNKNNSVIVIKKSKKMDEEDINIIIDYQRENKTNDFPEPYGSDVVVLDISGILEESFNGDVDFGQRLYYTNNVENYGNQELKPIENIENAYTKDGKIKLFSGTNLVENFVYDQETSSEVRFYKSNPSVRFFNEKKYYSISMPAKSVLEGKLLLNGKFPSLKENVLELKDSDCEYGCAITFEFLSVDSDFEFLKLFASGDPEEVVIDKNFRFIGDYSYLNDQLEEYTLDEVARILREQ